MKTLCSEEGVLREDWLEIGKYYNVEPLATGTLAQNNTFHALVLAYWSSGCFSQPARTYDELRNFIKRDLGAGFENFIYIGDDMTLHQVDTREEIPEHIRDDFTKCVGKLKSWSKYSKKERRQTIDNLITEMETVGVNTPKYREILQGMSKELWT